MQEKIRFEELHIQEKIHVCRRRSEFKKLNGEPPLRLGGQKRGSRNMQRGFIYIQCSWRMNGKNSLKGKRTS